MGLAQGDFDGSITSFVKYSSSFFLKILRISWLMGPGGRLTGLAVVLISCTIASVLPTAPPGSGIMASKLYHVKVFFSNISSGYFSRPTTRCLSENIFCNILLLFVTSRFFIGRFLRSFVFETVQLSQT